jgi:hypothetical protein
VDPVYEAFRGVAYAIIHPLHMHTHALTDTDIHTLTHTCKYTHVHSVGRVCVAAGVPSCWLV